MSIHVSKKIRIGYEENRSIKLIQVTENCGKSARISGHREKRCYLQNRAIKKELGFKLLFAELFYFSSCSLRSLLFLS